MHGEVTMKKPEMIGGFDKYEVESAFETLTKAREILKDDKKVAAVKLYAKKRIAATQEVAAQLNLEATVGKKLTSVFQGD
jgi:hypothetical protein